MHPQHWPEDLDYRGKRVVVIGSGATAVTLIPAMAIEAAHVTMLQRSPSYIWSLPSSDKIANTLPKLLGGKRAYVLTRQKNIIRQRALFGFCQRYPRAARKLIRYLTAKQLPKGYLVDEHFNPTYNPWDQRLCVVPDGDLFEAIRDGSASVVTDQIDTFTERGIKLASGRELEADIIVTATGLNMQPLGGITLTVDGAAVNLPERVTFRSFMLDRVPNFAFVFGYSHTSWTLKVGLVASTSADCSPIWTPTVIPSAIPNSATRTCRPGRSWNSAPATSSAQWSSSRAKARMARGGCRWTTALTSRRYARVQ